MKKQKKLSSGPRSLKDTDDPLANELSEFILEGLREGSWQVGRFELQDKKDKTISLRLSDRLLKELKTQAALLGLDTQKFIRLALESVVRKKTG